GLGRKDVDFASATHRVQQRRTMTAAGKSLVKEMKTAPGRRTIAIPEFLAKRFCGHLGRRIWSGRFCLHRHTLHRESSQVAWHRVRTAVGRSAAGRRRFSAPAHAMKAVEDHLDRFTGADGENLVISSAWVEPLSMNVLQRAWTEARQSIGQEDLHHHDLRHTGLTLAAATGAVTVELMHR